MCYSCTPNMRVVPPVLCDDPANYTTVNCSDKVPCFITTALTSINRPVYVLGCADVSKTISHAQFPVRTLNNED